MSAAERWLEAGDLALGLGLLPDAVSAYQQATGTPPFVPRALTGLGLARFAQGELEAARAALKRAEEAAPDLAEPTLLLGELALFVGDANRAQERFALAKKRGDQSPEREMYEALALALLGRTAEAKARIEPLVAGDPTPWAQLVHAFCLERIDDAAGARAIYEALARGEGPAKGLAAAALAALYASAGEMDAAFAAYKNASDAGYAPAEVALALSRLSLRAGDPARGLRLVRLARSLRPADAEILYDVGLSELRAGHLALAKNALGDAARVALDPSLVACARGRLLYGEGRYEEAAARFATVGEEGEAGAYAKEARRRIAQAAGRLVWRDGFDRPDGPSVQNRWKESERFGIEVSLQGGAVRFGGVQTRDTLGQTALVREVESARFSGLRARLQVPPGSRARFGISVRLGQREVRLYRDGDGALRSSWKGSGRQTPEPVDLGRLEGRAHELSIAVEGANRSELVFRLDGREVGRARSKSLAERGTFAATIFCEAPLGEAVDLACDEATLFRTLE